MLVHACRTAQRLRKGSGIRFGPVSPEAIRLAVPADQLWLLGLGPKRGLRKALADAAARHPAELWQERKGWRSLGLRPEQRSAPARELEPRAGRTRSGLGVRREVAGSGG